MLFVDQPLNRQPIQRALDPKFARFQSELLHPYDAIGKYTAFPGRSNPTLKGTSQGLTIDFDSTLATCLQGPTTLNGYPYFFVARAFFNDVATNNVLSSIGALTDFNRVQIDVDAGNLRFINVGSSTQTAQTTVSTNTWYDIVAAGRSATDRALYVNGIALATSTTSSTFGLNWTGVVFGANANGSHLQGTQFISADCAVACWFQGWIDDATARQLSKDVLAIYKPRRIWVPVAEAAAAGAVGRADETDTALALAAVQILAAGVATEADTSLALAAVQVQATGRSDETDAAQALAAVQLTATGRADETGAAQSLAAVQIAVVGRADETDTALELAPNVSGVVGRADETDTALALAPVQIAAVGLAGEADVALALVPLAIAPVGLAIEVDAALALAARQSAGVGVAEEMDSALALGAATGYAAGLASEVDQAFSLTALQIGAVGLALEIDTAFALSDGVIETSASDTFYVAADNRTFVVAADNRRFMVPPDAAFTVQ